MHVGGAKRAGLGWAQGLTLGLSVLIAPLMVACSGDYPPRSEINRPWPAPVNADVPDAQPALTPEQALETFTMAPGYRLELAAAEPLVQDPILAEFDGDGRLWVVELPAFAINQNMDNSFEPINRIVILDDTDGDRVFDQRTVFIDQLIMPRAFKILDKNCVLVGAPPELIHACDTNGDLVADTREVIDNTFSTLGVVEHGANGLYWGMDNTIYVSEHTWNVKYENGQFRTAPSLNRGQWGITQDDAGRIYRNVNTDPLFVDYVAPDYYARNPNLVRTMGLYQSLVDQEKTMIWPARPTRGLNRGYRTDVLRPDGSSSYYGGVSSPMIYRGARLPEDVRGMAFVADGPTNIVHLLNLVDDGAGNLSATDYYERGEFLASIDERFRPVALTPSWDGTFYILDMYRGVSQDGPLQTDYLRNYIQERALWEHVNLGRVYRVTHRGMRFDERPSMSDDTPAELVAHLSHANGWWRDTAQQLLVQRNDAAAVPLLAELVRTSENQNARLHALWTLSGMNAVDAALVTQALGDASPAVRAAALRLSERWLRENDAAMRAAVLAMSDDANWTVRRQLAASLGELPVSSRIEPILAMLSRYGDDAVTIDSAISGLAGMEARALDAVLAQPAPNADVVEMLAGAIAKAKQAAPTQRLIALAADASRAEPVRIALLNGVVAGLSGQTSGGPAVAGGRAGGGIPGVARQRQLSVQINLPSHPRQLTAMASGSGVLAQAAATATSVIGWPGKPRPTAPPRTPAEETLFQQGRELYTSTCEGCHMPEGQGVPGVGAVLAGSPFVTGNPNVTVRILLHGKEGPIGLMPPAGQSMSDEEIAAVTTYIRQSFGNIASPVPPAGVKEWRQAYTHRATPWTPDELEARAR